MPTAAASSGKKVPAPALVRRWRRRLVVLPLLLGLMHWSGLARLPPIDSLDYALDDLRQRISLDDRPEQRIVIVDTDDPRPGGTAGRSARRAQLARLADELFVRQRADVVGFGMAFPYPDPGEGLGLIDRLSAGALGKQAPLARELQELRPALDHDAAFARALAGRRAVLGFEWHDSVPVAAGNATVGQLPAPLETRPSGSMAILPPSHPAAIGNLPALADAAGRAGFVDLQPDDDGVVRSLPLLAVTPLDSSWLQVHQGFALAVLRAARGDAAVEWKGGTRLLLHSPRGPAQELALDGDAAVRVPYRRASQFRILPAAEVAAARLRPGELAGRIVLVGPMAQSPTELKPTPLHSTTPGLLVQASLLAGLLDGRLPQQPAWARGFEAASLAAGCVLLAWLLPRLRARVALGVALLAGAAWLSTNILLYRAAGWVLPAALPMVGAGATAALVIFFAYADEARSRRALARLFGAYVPPELVRSMASDPERYTHEGMSADNRELTILFCDLRDFTRTAERLVPEQLREVVNLFFSRMSAVVARHGGTLDKYIGDAVMAFWGAPLAAPDHAARAVRAALDMAGELDGLNADLRHRGLPEVQMGIGLNTGLVCVGDLGSDTRRNYSVIGDAVNLAARIEPLTRQFDVPVLVGEATWKAAHDATADLPWRVVGLVPVKGRDEPVTVYAPTAVAHAHAADIPGIPPEDEAMAAQSLQAAPAGDPHKRESAPSHPPSTMDRLHQH